jgi:anhydro-N-acetylmuramic acid kinase
VIALSKVLTCLGLMSGTSLDGIDVALLRTDGEKIAERGPARTFPYDSDSRVLLRRALEDAVAMASRSERPGCLVEVEAALTTWHADAVKQFCKSISLKHSNIDLIGFHGQTVLHRPESRLTVQLGDGRALAEMTGITVAFDMRAADVAAGGQGAPLVPVYHRALADNVSALPVVFLNVGGVANITWVGADGTLVAFDTGPGNALLNDWCERHGRGPMDINGELAAAGVTDEDALSRLMAHPYFAAGLPKSLDRNSFSHLDLLHLDAADGARTLTAFTAAAVAAAIAQMRKRPNIVIVCGGGRHNPVMMMEIATRLHGIEVRPAEDLALDGDSMEAEAWAFLGARCLLGLPLSYPDTTGVESAMTGGIIARPLGFSG